MRKGANGSALLISKPLIEEIHTQMNKLKKDAMTKVIKILGVPIHSPNTKPSCRSPNPIPCLLETRDVRSMINPRLPPPTSPPKIDSFNGKKPIDRNTSSKIITSIIKDNGMRMVNPSIQAIIKKREKSITRKLASRGLLKRKHQLHPAPDKNSTIGY